MNFEKLKPIAKTLDSSADNLVEDFFLPVLKETLNYDRGVGYFTSGWLSSVSEGLVPLVERSGKIRLITSPYIDSRDYEAIKLGDLAKNDKALHSCLEKSIDKLENELTNDVRVALSWMIADDILQLKIAIPTERLQDGDFHVKFGIFTDEEDNKIVFTGSYNDTQHANLNFEELTIFNSFNPEFSEIIDRKEKLFKRIWEGRDKNLKVYNLPEAIKNKLVQLKENSPRPYKMPGLNPTGTNQPRVPDNLTPREKQKEAIKEWKLNGRRGILEMATGTGKTKTAFFALIDLVQEQKSLIAIIACPQKPIADQWIEESEKFNFRILTAFSDNSSWKTQLHTRVAEIKLGHLKYLAIICTHHTLKDETFKEKLAAINPDKTKIILIADECHHLNTVDSKNRVIQKIDFALGLSATPTKLYGQEEADDFTKDYLGPVVFKYTLSEAIRDGILCEYEYYHYPVLLTPEEVDDYRDISNKIKKFWKIKKEKSQLNENNFNLLLFERANILKKAKNKINKLKEILTEGQKVVENSVIFCAPNTDELDKVAKMLNEINIVSIRFTGKENNRERKDILDNFKQGIYKVITAMNIFNEGIDVPEIREGYFLSSSANPMEYIQRRGRILRKPDNCPNKKAILHDFIVMPPKEAGSESNAAKESDRAIIKKEIKRFYLFAESAVNSMQQINAINTTMKKYFDL
jgi:superfamily II DNA or RNA helicase